MEQIKIKDYDSGWIEIFINDKLVYENHSINYKTLLDLLKIKYSYESIEDDKD